MKKLLFLVSMLLCLTMLCGCTLARPDMGAEAYTTPDRLVGVYITTEHVDRFDFEAYFNDNASAIVNGGEISASDASAYSGRVYAVKDESGNYVFPETNGIAYFFTYESDDVATYYASHGDVGISDTNTHFNSSETEDSIDLSATVYGIAGQSIQAFYLNPVYQTSDGDVYLLPGNGVSGSTSVGMIMSQTFSESHDVMSDEGDIIKQSSSVKIAYSIIEKPLSYTFIEMDASSSEILRREYKIGSVPDEYTADKDTAYIIVETHYSDSTEYAVCQRSDNEQAHIDTLLELESMGVLYKKYTYVTFNEISGSYTA